MQRLTLAELKERYAAEVAVDRLERLRWLQHIANYPLRHFLDGLVMALRNVFLGWFVGVTLSLLSLIPFLEQVSAAFASVCR